MTCPNCLGDGFELVGDHDPQRDHEATCPECNGRRRVADTAGVRLCRAYYVIEPDEQGTSADRVYAEEREYWDRMAEAAEYVRQADAPKSARDIVLEGLAATTEAALLEVEP